MGKPHRRLTGERMAWRHGKAPVLPPRGPTAGNPADASGNSGAVAAPYSRQQLCSLLALHV
eukprot:scaffold5980_cov145-Isochrysis_galbana.AAC.8